MNDSQPPENRASQYQHFVLTRFNIASKGREAPIRNVPGWLGRRFDLFEAYCLPSIASQTQRDFSWLIYFDEQTPTEFRDRISALREIFDFEPIFVGPFEAGTAVREIGDRLIAGTDRLITTRLDNDDAVAKTYLEQVRKEAELSSDNTIINFSNGVAICDGRAYSAVDESNPFASMVEPVGNFETIWAAPHTELARRYNVRQLDTAPTWLQVVHGENVTNRIKGSRLDDQSVVRSFSLAETVKLVPARRGELLLDRVLFAPFRALRENAIRSAKKVLGRR